jgi:hypothetical protein
MTGLREQLALVLDGDKDAPAVGPQAHQDVDPGRWRPRPDRGITWRSSHDDVAASFTRHPIASHCTCDACEAQRERTT